MTLEMLAPSSYPQTSGADPIRYYRWPLVGQLFRLRVARSVSLLPRGRRVLEIGYGSGVSFLNLGRKFEEIHGVDVHDRNEEVSSAFRRVGVSTTLRRGTVTELPYPSDYFDAALAISVHEELDLEIQRAAFAEVERVLRHGGSYVVGIPGVNVFMNTAFYALGWRIGRYHVCSDQQVLDAMAERFQVDNVQFLPRLWPRALTMYVCARGVKQK